MHLLGKARARFRGLRALLPAQRMVFEQAFHGGHQPVQQLIGIADHVEPFMLMLFQCLS